MVVTTDMVSRALAKAMRCLRLRIAAMEQSAEAAEAEVARLREELEYTQQSALNAQLEWNKSHAEVERIRTALGGYPDSDLVSLATTLNARNEALEAENERLRHLLEAVELDEIRMMLARDEAEAEVVRLRAAITEVADAYAAYRGKVGGSGVAGELRAILSADR